MKLSEVPEQYKIYTLVMSSKTEYEVNGVQKLNIINAPTNWVELPNGSTINKAFGIEFRLDYEKTKENIRENIESIKRLS
jgi:hypothetical protein